MALSVLLLALLGVSILNGVGDLRVLVLLGIGAVLGLVYAVSGELPEWIIRYSGGKITADDDSANISPRTYLPILLGVVVLAIVICVVVLW